MKLFYLTFGLILFSFISPVKAHKNFWEIKATAIPDNEKITFSIFFSLEQLKEKFPEKFPQTEYHVEKEKEFTESIIKVAPNVLTLEAREKAIKPFIKHVGLITSSFEEEERIFSIAQVDVELEIIFPLPESVKDFKVYWKVFTDSLLKKKDVKITPNDITINILDHQFSQYKVNSQNPSFIWKREENLKTPKLKVVNHSEQVQVQRSSYILPSLIALLLAIIIWTFTIKKSLIVMSYLFLVTALSFFCLSFTKSKMEIHTKKLPENEQIAKFMKYSLYKIYLSVNRKDWNNMTEVSSKEFLENLILENYDSNLEKLPSFIEQISLSEIKVLSNNSIKFDWYAKTLFQHLSHTHSKDLFFSGEFTFSESGQNWLISNAKVRQIFAKEE